MVIIQPSDSLLHQNLPNTAALHGKNALGDDDANRRAQQDPWALRELPQHVLIFEPDPAQSTFREVTRFVP